MKAALVPSFCRAQARFAGAPPGYGVLQHVESPFASTRLRDYRHVGMQVVVQCQFRLAKLQEALATHQDFTSSRGTPRCSAMQSAHVLAFWCPGGQERLAGVQLCEGPTKEGFAE